MKKIIIFIVSLVIILSIQAISTFAAVITVTSATLDANTKAARVTGKIDLGAGKQITIKVVSSDGSIIDYLNETTSGANGEFSFSYTMLNDATKGYNITIGGQDVATPVQTTFNYIGNEPAVSNSTIAPTTASFDKETLAQADIVVTLTLNGNTLNEIKNGTTPLTLNDYTVENNKVTIKKSYLTGLPVGNAKLTFDFSNGIDPELSITVKDTTPSGGGGSVYVPSISTTTQTNTNSQQSNETSSDITGLSEQITSEADEKSRQGLLSKAVDTIKNIGSSLSEDDKKAADSTLDVLNAAIKINSLTSSPELVQEAEKVAEKAVEQLTIQNIESNDSKVTLSSEQTNNLLEKIALFAQVNEINSKLQQLGINNGTENKIVLEVNTNSNSNVEVRLPTEILSKAQSSGIGKIEISTPVASILVPPSAVSTDGSAFTLGAKEVKNSELTQEQQKLVGSSPVYDFSASTIGADGQEQKLSQFNDNIEISLPYELKDGEDPDKITVFFLNDSGQLENKIGIYDPAAKTVRFTTNHFSKYFIKCNNVTFKDIERVKSWAGKEIEVMASKGIINGREEKIFDPDASITRAEFVALVTRSMNIVKSSLTTTFKDVDKAKWYYDEVASAQKAGILKASDGKEFRPNDAITREEMAVFMARAMRSIKKINNDSKKFTNIIKFKDYKAISPSMRKDVEYIVNNQIMQGMSNTIFEPAGKATRAQAAVVIYRMWTK